MVTLNKEYQSQPDAIQSYAYTDIASGTGFVKYYGYVSKTSAGLGYHLGTAQVYSSHGGAGAGEAGIEVHWGVTTTSFDEDGDLNFDLTAFNKPQTIRGTATLNICLSAYNNTNITEAYIIAKIRKYSTATGEVEIASTQSQTIRSDLYAGTTNNAILNIPITIPQTEFKVGETLRLTVGLWAKLDAGTARAGFGTDPMNRDGEVYIAPSTDAPTSMTKLELYVPYKIDI